MAVVEVLARLKADASGFTTTLKKAKDSLSDLDGAMGAASSKLQSFGNSAAAAGGKASLSLTTPLALAGGVALKTASDFESSMSQVAQAVGKPGQQLDELKTLAIEMGAATRYSANESAQAMVELAKGGFDEAAISGGALQATMSLAAAGGLELADAGMQIVASMNSFGMSAADSSQIADALAGAANASSADVSDLGQALTQAAAQASISGQSLQGTTAALAALADMGIKGSDAGTSLKTMMMRMVPATDDAAAAMQKYGLNFVNADGSMKTLQEAAGQLQSQLGGLSEAEKIAALETMFGTDAMRAAAAMMNVGSDGLAKYEAATSKVGTAQEAATARMGPTARAMEEMSGAIETAMLQIGEVMAPIVTKLAIKVQELAQWFGGLGTGVKQFVTIAGVGLAAIGPALVGIGIAAKAVGSGLSAMGRLLGVVAKAGGLFAKALMLGKNAIYAVRVAWAALSLAFTSSPIGWIVLAIGALVAAFVIAYQKIPAFREAVQAAFAKIKEVIGKVLDWLRPAVQAVMGAVKAAFDWAMDNIWPKVQQAFGVIMDVVRGAMGVIGNIVTFVWPFIVTYVKTYLTVLWTVVKAIFTAISTYVKFVWGVISAVIRFAVDKIWPVVKAGFEAIRNVVVPIMSAVLGAIRTGWETASAVVQFAVDKIWPVVQTAFGIIKGVVETVMSVVVVLIKLGWIAIRAAFEYALNTIWPLVQWAFNAIRNTISAVMNAVSSVISTVWGVIRGVVGGAVSFVWSTVQTGFNAVQTVVSTVMNAVSSVVSTVWGAIRGVWDNSVGRLVSKASEGMESIRSGISTALDRVQSLFSSAVSNIGAIWDKVTDVVKAPIRGMFSWINDNMIDPINSVLGKFGESVQIKRLPAFKDGGQVAGPGTGRSDSVLARLSRGEYVVNAKATQANLGLLEAINRGRAMPGTDAPPTGAQVAMAQMAPAGQLGVGGVTDWARNAIGAAVGVVSAGADLIGDLVARGASFAVKALVDPALDWLQGNFGGTWSGDVVLGAMRTFADKIKEWGQDKDAAAAAAASAGGAYLGPVSGEWQLPVSGYVVSSEYGYRANPTGAGYQLHGGIDLAAAMGTPIWAASNGLVTMAGWNDGYGNFVEISHGGGISTQYGHMQSISVAAGQTIPRGAMIGTVGSTGDSTGAHLHFNTLQGGAAMNPRSFMAAHGIAFDSGGFLPPGISTVVNGTGKPEPVLTAKQWDDLTKGPLAIPARGGTSRGLVNWGDILGLEDLKKLMKSVKSITGGVMKGAVHALFAALPALDKWRETVVGIIDSAADSVAGYAGFRGVAPSGERGWSVADVLAGMGQRLDRVRDFTETIDALRAAGLAQAPLQELLAMGVEQGFEAGRAMLEDASRIGELNRAYEDLAAAGTRLGMTEAAIATGRTVGEVAGMTETRVTVESGAVVLNFGAGVSSADRNELRRTVDAAVREAMAALAQELNRA